MKSIIINTLKISVAAILAILCAQALRLDFAVSAGIVAILSVQPTQKETLRTALARLFAFAVALVISFHRAHALCLPQKDFRRISQGQ